MAIYERKFIRQNVDGTTQTVTMSWDSENPLATMKTEASGYSGSTCLSELGNIEKVIGAAKVDAKPEAYVGEDPREVFIVGMQ